jgi:hypothetical protein
LAGGQIREGDVVTALPSGRQSRVQSIVTYDGSIPQAFSPMSVTLKLEDEIDLSRGDMLVSPHDPPHVSRRFAAMLVWMHVQPLEIGRIYLIKQCARQVRGRVTTIRHRVNIDTMNPEVSEQLRMNDIAAVELETNTPLFFDSYEQNRITGSFIVIDSLTNATLGAGMIREDLAENDEELSRQETSDSEGRITAPERYRRHGHLPAIMLVSAGHALARRVERALFEDGFAVMLVEKSGSTDSPRAAWNTLYAAGFVVIYWNPSLAIEEKLDLKAMAGDSFFDLAEMNLPDGDAKAVGRVRTLAESLRIPRGTDHPGSAI